MTWTCPFCHKDHARTQIGPVTVAQCEPKDDSDD